MTKMWNALLLTWTWMSLSACTTVGTWEDGMPREKADLKTDSERQNEFKRFYIRDAGVTFTGKPYFEVRSNKDGETKRVSATSFYPVVEHVSPRVKEAIEAAQRNHTNAAIGDTATYTGMAVGILGPKQWMRDAGTGVMAAGAIGSAVFSHMEREELLRVMEIYNSDLTHRIYIGHDDDIPST